MATARATVEEYLAAAGREGSAWDRLCLGPSLPRDEPGGER